MVELDDIVSSETAFKAGKYTGYAIEAFGLLTIIYGVCIDSDFTMLAGFSVAYTGTYFHRSFGYLLNKDNNDHKNRANIDNTIP